MAFHEVKGAAAGAALLAITASLAVTTRAFADETATPEGPAPTPDANDAQKHKIDRTWLYVDDARVAEPLVFIGMSNVSYTDAGSSPTRIVSPFPSVYNSFASNTAQPGGMITLGGEVGLLPRLSVIALGEMGFAGMGPSPNAGAIAGIRVQLLPPSSQNLHLVASGGYLREAWQGPVFNDDTGKWLPGSPNGDNGAWLQVAISGDIRDLRLAATVHGEHIFSDGRDALDLMVQAGVSYRIVSALRLGVWSKWGKTWNSRSATEPRAALATSSGRPLRCSF